MLALGSHPPPRVLPPRGPACRFIFPGRLATNLFFIRRLSYLYREPDWKLLSPAGPLGPALVSIRRIFVGGSQKRRGRGSTEHVRHGSTDQAGERGCLPALADHPIPKSRRREHHPKGKSREIRWETPPAASPRHWGTCSFRLNRLKVIVPVIETD